MRTPWYWNRDNFEALATMAAELEALPGLAGLAQWCTLREQGLRKQAFAALETMLRGANDWPAEEARATVVQILNIHRKHPQAHWFLSQPLRTRLLEPVLEAWRAEDPAAVVPQCELALLGSDFEALSAALVVASAQAAAAAFESNPENPQARDQAQAQACAYAEALRLRVITALLDRVDYATHHLNEGLFLGDPALAALDVSTARALIAELNTPEAAQHLQTFAESLQDLLADWARFNTLEPRPPRHTFPTWCAAQGHRHRWWSTVYYDG